MSPYICAEEPDVLAAAQQVVERKCLRRDAERCAGGRHARVVPVHPDPSSVGRQQSDGETDSGALAGAVWSEQPKDLAARHGERESVDRDERAVLFTNVIKGQHGRS